jgi:UDP-3-O-[3-hydroxymyristoyl] glucosamine N-acyltransferase
MTYPLSKLTQALDLTFDKQDLDITGIHTLSEASSSQLSFFSDSKHLLELAHTKAGAVLIDAKHAHLLPSSCIALLTDEAYLKLAQASKFFAYSISSKEATPKQGKNCDISPLAHFGSNVSLGDNVCILAGAYLGDNVHIGSNTLIYANVSIYHHSLIGADCIIYSGAVIGCDGYGFAHTRQGEHIKIYQNGNVVIEDKVEIGANCAIDRAVFGTTYIRQGSKLDNLIQIAHNCDIGEHTLMASQVGLAGSTTLGRNVVMGGQSASAGHLHIGAFATVAGKGGVTKSLEGKKTYAGFPAIEHKRWLKIQAKISGLLKRKKV